MLVSVVIRTYNEARHLDALLQKIADQRCSDFDCEVVVVDSGSTDATLAIATSHGCRITHIDKSEFTFGRSLNYGCNFARGEILVFISGHCLPVDEYWLHNLVDPLRRNLAAYSYGRQIGHDTTRFSERQVFAKYYPSQSRVPQQGFYCNNANAAITRKDWAESQFDEELTGLEDMHLAKLLVQRGRPIAYIAEAGVHHIHDESWRQVKIRYEREAIALQKIMPEIHVHLLDFMRYFASAVISDCAAAWRMRNLRKFWREIVAFRFCQFWGGYKGNHIHRRLSKQVKEHYFYPTLSISGNRNEQDHSAASHESSQRAREGQEFQNAGGNAVVRMDSRQLARGRRH